MGRLLLVPLTALAVLAWGSGSTLSGWASAVVANPTSTTAIGRLMPPTAMSCSGGGLLTSPTLSWTAPTSGIAPNQYTVTYRAGSATASPTTVTTTSTSWQMPAGLLSLIQDFYISVQSSLAGTSWVSASANPGQIVNITSILFIGAVSSCNGSFTPAA